MWPCFTRMRSAVRICHVPPLKIRHLRKRRCLICFLCPPWGRSDFSMGTFTVSSASQRAAWANGWGRSHPPNPTFPNSGHDLPQFWRPRPPRRLLLPSCSQGRCRPILRRTSRTVSLSSDMVRANCGRVVFCVRTRYGRRRSFFSRGRAKMSQPNHRPHISLTTNSKSLSYSIFRGPSTSFCDISAVFSPPSVRNQKAGSCSYTCSR